MRERRRRRAKGEREREISSKAGAFRQETTETSEKGRSVGHCDITMKYNNRFNMKPWNGLTVQQIAATDY